ncbi:MAG: apolipoprotein N-acyltransferase [Bacteroidales bacterium]|nr:apolipoprotein N-acyltransferase [Bacteroidales bacterium]
MKASVRIGLLSLLSGVLLSAPWLVPHSAPVALFAFVPLLLAAREARRTGMRGFFWCHYAAFVLWNALTTFWVCNATLGGGLFAIFANALKMSLIFELFRLARRKWSGVLPYLFLAAVWMAWEHLYFDVQISWPWLVLGNALAGSTELAQWYEFTGVMGGSLWIWASNLFLFALAVRLPSRLPLRRRVALRIAGWSILLLPPALSLGIYASWHEVNEGSVPVVVGQPNFDPYHKFESMSQREQDEVLLRLFASARADSSSATLFLAPETFTASYILKGSSGPNETALRFAQFLQGHPHGAVLFGASTYDIYGPGPAPSAVARKFGGGWLDAHNSALLLPAGGPVQVYHKSRLVVGTELLPFPKIFVPIDDALGGVMGRCTGQKEVGLLHFGAVPLGCAVCYESIFPEYCAGYVRKGAKALTVITNDAWWGNTPGYRQHFSYSRLRAIELRRDIARCGNTGISAFINQRGNVLSRTPWWQEAVLEGSVNLSSRKTFFVRYGDIVGRIACLVAALLLLSLLADCIGGKRKISA